MWWLGVYYYKKSLSFPNSQIPEAYSSLLVVGQKLKIAPPPKRPNFLINHPKMPKYSFKRAGPLRFRKNIYIDIWIHDTDTPLYLYIRLRYSTWDFSTKSFLSRLRPSAERETTGMRRIKTWWGSCRLESLVISVKMSLQWNNWFEPDIAIKI